MTMIVPSSVDHHHHAESLAAAAHSEEKGVTLAAEDVVVTTDDESDCDSDSSFDACDALFQQGDLLRRLRQLEREDEALREQERLEQQEQEQDDNSNTLQYKDYLQHQEGIYDDYKHVNYQYIDFGIIDAGSSSDCDSDSSGNASASSTKTPLIIEQDRTVGKGGFVWDAGFILAESVLNMEQQETEWLNTNQRTKIIELGAGTGVTSLMIAKAHPNATVHLTDLPQLQPLLSKNCQTCPGQATCGVLEWGKPVGEDAPYDIILGADVVAGIYDSSGLAKTIYDLSHSKTVVYLACRERLQGVIDRFEFYLSELFTKIERREADSSNRSPNVFILKVSGKRVYGEDKDDKSIQVVS